MHGGNYCNFVPTNRLIEYNVIYPIFYMEVSKIFDFRGFRSFLERGGEVIVKKTLVCPTFCRTNQRFR